MHSVPLPIQRIKDEDRSLRSLLAAWSAINSGSDHIEGLDRMRGALKRTFSEAFPAATIEEPELVGSKARAFRMLLRPSASRRVLLNGHYDTVYEAQHPFQMPRLIDADTLNGPGVSDMKGGIVVMLAALRALEATPEAKQLGVEVLLTPDEEIGSQASRAEIELSAKRNHFGFVFEPARVGGEIVRSRMGTGTIEIAVHGRSAHGAQPELGRNAIVALAQILTEVDSIPRRVPGAMLNVGSVRGGGVINIVPDFASAELHARITQIEQREHILAEVEKAVAPVRSKEGYRVGVHAAFDRPPKSCGPREQAMFKAYNACSADLGLGSIDWVDTGGGSDGNLLSAAGLPNLDGLGPIGHHLHSEQEFVFLPSVVLRAQVAALLLHRIATGELPIS
ncbi:MAG: hydrolase [Opitutaceae bacterium]|nr:hydrolase [Opitutaceae bacterium]